MHNAVISVSINGCRFLYLKKTNERSDFRIRGYPKMLDEALGHF